MNTLTRKHRHVPNRKARHATDIGMGIALAGMALAELLPENLHSIFAIILYTLVAAHLIQHKQWLRALARGTWGRKRIRQTVSALAPAPFLLVCAALGLAAPFNMTDYLYAGGFYGIALPHHVLGYLAVFVCACHAFLKTSKRIRRK